MFLAFKKQPQGGWEKYLLLSACKTVKEPGMGRTWTYPSCSQILTIIVLFK